MLKVTHQGAARVRYSWGKVWYLRLPCLFLIFYTNICRTSAETADAAGKKKMEPRGPTSPIRQSDTKQKPEGTTACKWKNKYWTMTHFVLCMSLGLNQKCQCVIFIYLLHLLWLQPLVFQAELSVWCMCLCALENNFWVKRHLILIYGILVYRV